MYSTQELWLPFPAEITLRIAAQIEVEPYTCNLKFLDARRELEPQAAAVAASKSRAGFPLPVHNLRLVCHAWNKIIQRCLLESFDGVICLRIKDIRPLLRDRIPRWLAAATVEIRVPVFPEPGDLAYTLDLLLLGDDNRIDPLVFRGLKRICLVAPRGETIEDDEDDGSGSGSGGRHRPTSADLWSEFSLVTNESCDFDLMEWPIKPTRYIMREWQRGRWDPFVSELNGTTTPGEEENSDTREIKVLVCGIFGLFRAEELDIDVGMSLGKFAAETVVKLEEENARIVKRQGMLP